MIFYFTGTGNSLAAARRLLQQDEQLVNMADALYHNEYEYKVKDEEQVGFVFPVYFYTLPTIVRQFIERLKLENAHYIYAVITCGGGIAQAGAVLKKALGQSNLGLDYLAELVMPDNYILLYNNPVEGVDECLAKADERLYTIAADISKGQISTIGNNTILSNLTAVMYETARKTSGFCAEDSCTGCGMCERNCPEKVIMLVNGKPEWTKKKCSQCLACISRCPARAIQYGKRTKKQGRYVHPELTF